MSKGYNEIGALWSSFSKNGNMFESGHIKLNGKKYIIRVYDKKNKKNKQPEKLIYLWGEEDIKNEK
ncbi:hypothetical protein [Brachyspira aalborgi]|jgi:hypothetical protein|uniref:Uncharacterized protein n=1 Tax=Brachyspira aalborgi TaxID=29522 RepID=A0ABY3K6Q5_9SPIR|nr:hypothetical protein [Brachyspira aalborgi]TXJ31194.1 hypothetical protein EPJ71_10695 [Brachyspira aalborgi]TXJ40084.1 hypothetical protein EPJ65_12635 [Brachyspira aalborgi]DAZ18891.1 MAG TPA: Profilin-1, plant protein, allergen, pollen.9A [Caudoviricetes sp.]